MRDVWRTYGDVLVGWLVLLPVAGMLVWGLIFWRRHHGMAAPVALRRSLAEAGAIVGTAPWLWMIMQPSAGQNRRINLEPLHDLLTVPVSALPVQVVGNLLVFAAAGFCLPIRCGWLAGLWRILGAATAGSAALEVLQYTLDIGRVSSVDDVLLNAVGAVAAAALSRRLWVTELPDNSLSTMVSEAENCRTSGLRSGHVTGSDPAGRASDARRVGRSRSRP